MIVVTTPTGAIGRQVIQLLLDSNSHNNSSVGERIRVVARDRARIPRQWCEDVLMPAVSSTTAA